MARILFRLIDDPSSFCLDFCFALFLHDGDRMFFCYFLMLLSLLFRLVVRPFVILVFEGVDWFLFFYLVRDFIPSIDDTHREEVFPSVESNVAHERDVFSRILLVVCHRYCRSCCSAVDWVSERKPLLFVYSVETFHRTERLYHVAPFPSLCQRCQSDALQPFFIRFSFLLRNQSN